MTKRIRCRFGAWRGALLASGIALLTAVPAASAPVTPCGGDFDRFIANFSREAAKEGISQRTLSAAFVGVTQDPDVIAFDRRQRATFKRSFEDYVRTRVTAPRLKRGAQMLQRHAGLFSRIEREFGVPAPILTAIWGLETDYGADTGKLPVVRVLATLAHDCRRTELFQRELLAAVTIIERGYLAPDEMRGAFAGELGQTQFLPSSYVKFAIDYDRSGRPDLIKSSADALASTANFLKSFGWKAGQPWHEGSHNFDVLRDWNRALIYRQTIAYFADRLATR